MKRCYDPRHGTPCYPETCPACQEECDPKYWREEDKMETDNINDNQWQELCEWAGWTWIEAPEILQQLGYEKIWINPDGAKECTKLIRDMNTLGKWIIPKLHEQGWYLCLVFEGNDSAYWVHFINFEDDLQSKTVVHKDFFESVAQATYNVIKYELSSQGE